MGYPQILDGQLHAPFFVFIRDWNVEDDQSALRVFGLEGYSSSQKVGDHDCYITFSKHGEWTQIADDWYYTLWHSRAFLDAVREIASTHEVFLFMVGDADFSFEIEYHKAGKLMRQFINDQPPFGSGKVLSDVGDPFPPESKITLGADPLRELWSIAASIGCPTTIQRSDLRLYSKRYERDAVNECPWDNRILSSQNSRAEQGADDQLPAQSRQPKE